MGLKMKNASLLFSLLLCLTSVLPGHAETKNVTDFNTLVDKYFDFYFSFHPSEATAEGFHQYERKLEDYSAAAYARQNLQNPPKIYTEIALEQLPDEADFFRKDVPEAFSAVTDPKLLAEFKVANQGVIDAFESYQKYLHDSILPNANGDFRLGPENYKKKLLYDEMVDIPLDRLLAMGYENLHQNQ